MKKLIFMGLCLALSSGLHAQTAQADPAAQSKKAAEPSCQETSPFVPPSIPWMGRYFYKVKVTLKNGQATEVEAKAVRGLDTVSDQIVEQSLQEHIKKNFVCEGAGATITFHLALNFEHELEALDQKQAELDAKTAASAATGLASEALIPLRADQICTSMGKPVVPDVYAVGTLILHAIAEVKDSKVTFVDIKLMRGSTDASVNEKFIKAIERAMRRTYVCPGNHVFEQEFQFSIS